MELIFSKVAGPHRLTLSKNELHYRFVLIGLSTPQEQLPQSRIQRKKTIILRFNVYYICCSSFSAVAASKFDSSMVDL